MFTAEVNRALVAAADLINTAEGPKSAIHTPDTIETVEGLRSFLKERPPQLQWPTATANATQLKKIRQLRTTLRRVWDTGPIPEEPDLELINELLDGVGTRLIRSAAPGEPSISEVPIPASSQIHHVMTATVAAALAHLVVAGEAGRLGICRGEDCQAAIVDLTRNRSKLFCDFGNCANRAHVRAYRARQATQQDNSASGGRSAPSLSGPSAAEKAEQPSASTSDSAVAATEFRKRMREELVQKRPKK